MTASTNQSTTTPTLRPSRPGLVFSISNQRLYMASPQEEDRSSKKQSDCHRQEPTPLQQKSAAGSRVAEAVSCYHCRPSPKRKQPQAATASSPHPSNHWHRVADDLANKLLVTTRERDAALQESSLLQEKLSGVERLLLLSPPAPDQNLPHLSLHDFLRATASARSATGLLARSLATRNPKAVQLESILNQVLYSGFELDSGTETRTPDPKERCRSNRADYDRILTLTWNQVLKKGTKHYSADLSHFCDEKMSQLADSVGLARKGAWPEPLLQAFFEAAKSVWLLRLLARSVYPPVPVIRVDGGTGFDGRFMEDAAKDRIKDLVVGVRLEPISVRKMVAPGFNVYVVGVEHGVVKCMVSCRYNRGIDNGSSKDDVAETKFDGDNSV